MRSSLAQRVGLYVIALEAQIGHAGLLPQAAGGGGPRVRSTASKRVQNSSALIRSAATRTGRSSLSAQRTCRCHTVGQYRQNGRGLADGGGHVPAGYGSAAES